MGIDMGMDWLFNVCIFVAVFAGLGLIIIAALVIGDMIKKRSGKAQENKEE